MGVEFLIYFFTSVCSWFSSNFLLVEQSGMGYAISSIPLPFPPEGSRRRVRVANRFRRSDVKRTPHGGGEGPRLCVIKVPYLAPPGRATCANSDSFIFRDR